MRSGSAGNREDIATFKSKEITMTRHAWCIAPVFAFAVSAAAQSQPPVSRPSPGVLSQVRNEITAKGTVEAVDAERRTVTVKFDGGYTDVVSVSPEMKRLDGVKTGARVNLRYYESVVLQLRRAGDSSPAPVASDSTASTPGTGENPGGTSARQRKATVTVVAIDKMAPSITVKTAEGYTVTRRVNDPKNLDGVSLGDQIDITYTEAMLVHVEPAT
jgi:hypothetical protein